MADDGYLWTVAGAADSAITFYELLVRRLDQHERDAFWADYARFGELFGMPRDVAPASYAEFRRWFDLVAKTELRRSEHGRGPVAATA